jgi:hypothetical protein
MFAPKPSSSVRMKKELERAKIAVMLSQTATIHTNLPEWFERLVAQAINKSCGLAGMYGYGLLEAAQ